MNKIEKIAKKIIASRDMPIRDFITSGITAFVSDEKHTWRCEYDGDAQLTPDGVARWSVNGILDLVMTVSGNEAVVHGIKTDEQEKSVCSLFNTLAGNVNENTFEKYVKK